MGYLKMIVLATDVPNHPRFGQSIQFNVSWISKNSFKIDGPDRPKWEFNRATGDVRLEFEAPKTA